VDIKMNKIDQKTMASMIDHTILKPSATKAQIIQLCKEAKEYQFASVCINPCFVKLASSELKGSGVKTCTVIGFPLGANTSELKAIEAKTAIMEGAQEVDMVINIGALKEGDLQYVENDIAKVVQASKGTLVKVIIETCFLTDEEKVSVCNLAKKAGAAFVKTSTGFGSGGATPADVALMRHTVGEGVGVKASGGVRNLTDALAVIEAGANRIGTSAGLAIMNELQNGVK
jgi:deoxyribose-phosphate aldolase